MSVMENLIKLNKDKATTVSLNNHNNSLNKSFNNY